ncbi:hypothetical protein LTR82_017811 [Friedmanniomyces endolithicus]|uniref:J domain-containing protein n=1 Tax=Friedmanniomyces endolithicus TaxID=329885 RepID=A0AAN6F400_9PEZI|nr:hypothetical protein LTR82_017811 [Friedmanniomyces endolithicus]
MNARKLYLLHHPDNGGNSQQFCKIRLAEEILTNVEDRSEFDRVYPKVYGAWQAHDTARAERLREEEAVFRRRQGEAQRRTEEAMRKAQQRQERAAYDRLQRLQEEEERLKLIEEERVKAMKGEERMRTEKFRLSAPQQEAEARTEAVAEKRRIQARLQAEEMLKQQIIENKL